MTALTRDQMLTQLADDITRLTRGWTETLRLPLPEDIRKKRKRRRFTTTTIKHRSLVEQLHDALTAPGAGDSSETGARKIPDSRPPVPSEPFAILMAIDQFQRETHTTLDQVVGSLALAPIDVLAATALEIHALTRRADITLGHQPAPRRLPDPCPICNRKHSLLINMTTTIVLDARCSACGTKWEHAELGMLARLLTSV